MFVIFGWEKTQESLGNVASGYCYHCRKHRAWIIGKETEWVRLYGIRTIPFLSKYHFVCEKCNDDIPIGRSELGQVKRAMGEKGSINGTEIHRALMERIKAQQLAGKTELQLKWIQASLEQEAEKNGRGSDATGADNP